MVLADDLTYGVGAAHLVEAPRPFAAGVHLFDFIR